MVITTTEEGARIINAALHLEAVDVGAWAAMPDEDSARRTLARIRRVQADVRRALAAAQITEAVA